MTTMMETEAPWKPRAVVPDESLPTPEHLQLHKRPGEQRQHQPGNQHPDAW